MIECSVPNKKFYKVIILVKIKKSEILLTKSKVTNILELQY